MTTDHPIPTAALDTDIAILGKKGKGKTYTAKGIVEQLLDAGRRVCVLDPLSTWWGLRASADGESAGYPIAVFGGEHGDMPLRENMARPLADIIARENLPCVLDLGAFRRNELIRFGIDFFDELFTTNRDPIWIVLEEADVFAPQSPMKDATHLLAEVDRIARRGRNFGFRLISLTQRPARLNKDVLTQLSTLVAMGVTSPQDRDAIKAWVDGNADRDEAKQVVDSLAKLPTGDGWIWAPDFEMLERVTFPRIKTLDTSATPKAGETRVEPKTLAQVDLGAVKSAIDADAEEARTLKELRAENTELRKRADAAGVPEREAKRREKAAYERGLSEVPARSGLSPQVRLVLESIHELAGDTLNGIRRDAKAASASKSKELAPPAKTPGPGKLRKGAVKILSELAARHPAGYSKAQVGALTGYSHKGGTFNTYLSDLRGLSYIDERDGLIFASDSGIESLGDDVPEKPRTHAAVMAMWQSALRAGAYRMLEAIVESGDQGIDKRSLAEVVEMTASGGTFNTYLSDLRRNGLIHDARGHYTAQDILFPQEPQS